MLGSFAEVRTLALGTAVAEVGRFFNNMFLIVCNNAEKQDYVMLLCEYSRTKERFSKFYN